MSKTSSEPITISVSALYGLTGGSILAYKLVSNNVTVDVNDSDWKNIYGIVSAEYVINRRKLNVDDSQIFEKFVYAISLANDKFCDTI